MNHVYRIVWNRIQNAWVVVAENAKSRGKSSGQKLLAALALTATFAHASPQGGQVVSGSGTINQAGNITTITQSTPNLSLNWKSFNIAPTETVNFVQPSSNAIAVNRIFDTNGTQILGHLDANGQVWLINPNGILFGQGAQVNVGGLVASTLDLKDSTGNVSTFSGKGAGSVVNEGTINGKYVALLGNHVSNQGVITARLGTVALGAGSSVTLTFSDDNLLHMQIDQSVLNSLAENGGLIRADGGYVIMNAGAKDALLASVVNNTGVIEARTVENHDGVITLLGGMQAGTVKVGGKLDASAPSGGNGGSIETSAAHVSVSDRAEITTAASSGLAGTWLIDPVDFTIAATGGDMTGAQVSAALNSGNVTILSSQGTTGTNGDINVNDTVSWSANKLTLNAQNDININSPMNGSGTASLALVVGNNYTINAPVNLPTGNNFSAQFGTTPAINYFVINSLGGPGDAATAPATMTLQGMAASTSLSGNYALGSNIDASSTSTWNSGAGFTPIGTQATPFTGNFEGLGHTISNLTINRPSTNYVGLFGDLSLNSSQIADLGLVGGSVNGSSYVGELAGLSSGYTYNSYATGSVSGSGTVGGLLGENDGSVDTSYATGRVSGSSYVGGLVGYNFWSITNSHATGNVSGNTYVGGLVGYSGSVSNSYATGSVNGYNYVGGLVGYNVGLISNSYAVGNVSDNDNNGSVGGLVGYNYGLIDMSEAEGNVSGSGYVGGLVGQNIQRSNNISINNSFATSNVTAASASAGGLVGLDGVTSNMSGLVNIVTISNSYATGSVTGDGTLGGLVGATTSGLSPEIVNSYATGNVTGLGDIGGFVGYNTGTISNCYSTGNVDNLDNLYAPGSSGGLVSGNAGTITNSYAIGNVTGVGYVGGLVGSNVAGKISSSYAAGNVNGGSDVGGLVGYNVSVSVYPSQADGDAFGKVTGTGSYVGGLVGWNDATSTVSGAYRSPLPGVGGGTTSGPNVNTIQASFTRLTDWFWLNFTTTPGAAGNNWVMVDTDGTLNNAGGSLGATLPMLASEYSTTISNAHQLQLMAMAPSASYTLGQNVNASNTSNAASDVWRYGWGFVPIGNAASSFTGTFDGLGRTISNLDINLPTTNDVGLFGYTGPGSVIRNVGLVGGSVSGASYVGGLVGANSGTITNAYVADNVTGSGDTGGLVGGNSGLVANSYAVGNVSGSTSVGYVGGLVGVNNAGGAIATSYATSKISGSSVFPGGLIGNNGGSVSQSYWDTNIAATGVAAGSAAGATGLTTAQMQLASNFAGFNFTTTPGATGNNWVMVDSDGTLNSAGGGASGAAFPMLSSEYSTTISNAHQLQLMVMAPSANYTLAQNIDASSANTATGFNDVWNTAGGFVPIGNAATPFSGSFDGAGYDVSNIYINLPVRYYVGLFGYTSPGSTVRNVGMSGGSITGYYSAGGLAGFNSGTISNSYAAVSVNGYYSIGGLVGYDNGSISNSHASGNVSGRGEVGGLVGYSGGTISNSYATGGVNGIVNGITGYNVGGLAGYNAGSISDSYATGGVNGINDSTTYIGGFVGYNGGTISQSYWDSDIVANGIGGGTAAGLTGLTSAQMQTQSSFVGWDFTNVWVMGASGPVLLNTP